MGKWIERCEKKIIGDIPKARTSSMGIVVEKREDENLESSSYPPLLENLTESERKAYQKCFDWLTAEDDSGEVPLSAKEAQIEAIKYIQKHGHKIRNEHFSLDYERDGFVNIYWADKERHVYIAKDERAKARVTDKTLQVFTEKEIEGFRGFTHAEKMLLMEARAIFNFNGVIEDDDQSEK